MVHLVVLRSLLSFSESEFLISGKYANLSFMHITISFSVLPENKIKKRVEVCFFWRILAEPQFESHAPLMHYLMNFSAVQVLHWEFGGLEQEEEVGSAQPHQDTSVFRGAKEQQVMRTGWLSSCSHGCCQINSCVSMGSDGTIPPCWAVNMDFKVSDWAGGAVWDW